MNNYMCKQCHSIWSDIQTRSTCPNCHKKTVELPMASEKSIRFRLVQLQGMWSLECNGHFKQTNQFEKISWSEEPSKELLHNTLIKQLKRWLEE